MLIEVCCGSVYDAEVSEQSGADRVELNSSMFLGGITPSIGEVIEVKKRLHIPIIAMVRPRGGGFCYTTSEFEVMKRDAHAFVDAGVDGIIFGILNEDGTVDYKRNKVLCDIGHSASIDVAFHRAFDVVPDVFASLETLIDMGIQRILTTGQRAHIEDGSHIIKKIVERSQGRIEILPAGMKLYNIKALSEYIGTTQAHISSLVSHKDSSCSHNAEIFFGGALYPPEMQFECIDPSFVGAMVDIYSSENKNLG